jgi:hypothetical protein
LQRCKMFHVEQNLTWKKNGDIVVEGAEEFTYSPSCPHMFHMEHARPFS